MANVKTFQGNKIGSTTGNYWFSGSANSTQVNYATILDRNNYALFEDQNSVKTYFADSANDSLSLVPEFDKQLEFRNVFKNNLRHNFARNMLFTSKPVLNCVRDFESTEADEELYGSVYMNYGIKSNLDLTQLYTQGNLKTFTINNEHYTLFTIPNQDGIGGANQSGNNNTAPGFKVVLAKGADLSTAVYIEKDFDLLNLNILSVNKDERIIYLMGAYDGYRQSADGEYLSSNYPEQYIVALPFNTINPDGIFSFDNHKMLLHYELTYYDNGGFAHGAYTNLFYLGLDSGDNDCFGSLTSFHNLNNNNTLELTFFKINYTTFTNATTNTTLPNSKLQYLDCFEVETFTLDADPNVATDYAQQHNAVPSKVFVFNDTDPNTKHFYIPLFLNNGNLAPLCVEWDSDEPTWADAFTLTENIISNQSIEGGAQGVTTAHIENPTASLSTLVDYAASYDAYWGTYITKNAGGDHKIHFIFNYIGTELYNSVFPTLTTKLNNCLSFAIDNANPADLTYESLSTFNNLNALLHKDGDSYTELVSLSTDGYKTYSYTPASGWTQGYHEQGTFTEYTTDSYDRRWAIEPPTLSDYEELVLSGYMYYRLYNVKLHLLSEVLPYSTSLRFATTNLTYTGAAFTSNVYVSAFDSTGALVAKDVTLSIEGTNVNFPTNGNASEITVLTSAAQETQVQIQITGPGYINISASFDV